MNRDKQKMMVVGVLGVLVLGIGAFQFTRGSDAPAPTTASTKKSLLDEEVDKKPTIKNAEFADALPRRDPFKTSPFAEVAEPVVPKAPVVVAPPTKHATSKGPATDWSQAPTGSLPDASGNGSGTGVTPVPVAEPKFGYILSGFMKGPKDIAIFQDASGNQKLVVEGQAIDGDATLVSVSRGSVRVKFHARTLVLTIGENSK